MLDLRPFAGKCSECGKFSSYRCRRCHAEFYCCRAHQRAAWPLHRERCKAPQQAPYVYIVPGSSGPANLQLALVGGNKNTSVSDGNGGALETLSAADLVPGMHVVVAPSSSHFDTYGAARGVVERVIQPNGGPAGRIKLRFLDDVRSGTPVALSAGDLCLAGTDSATGGVSSQSHGAASNTSSSNGAALSMPGSGPFQRQKPDISASWSSALANGYLSPLAVVTSSTSKSTLKPLSLSGTNSSNYNSIIGYNSTKRVDVSDTEPNQAALASLMALGFDDVSTAAALKRHHNCVEQAADWLLGGGGDLGSKSGDNAGGSNGTSSDAYAADDEGNEGTSKLAASVASGSWLFADEDDEDATGPWSSASKSSSESSSRRRTASSGSTFPWPGDAEINRAAGAAEALLASGCLYSQVHEVRGSGHGERFLVEAVRDGRAKGLGVRLRVTRASPLQSSTATRSSAVAPPTGSSSSGVHLALNDQQVRQLAETTLTSAPTDVTTTCAQNTRKATTTLDLLLDPSKTSDAERVAQLVPLLKLTPPRVPEDLLKTADHATTGPDSWPSQRLTVEPTPGHTFAISDDSLEPPSGLVSAAEPATIAASAAAMNMLSPSKRPPPLLPSTTTVLDPVHHDDDDDDYNDELSGESNAQASLLARYATQVDDEQPSNDRNKSDGAHGGDYDEGSADQGGGSGAARADGVAMLEAMGFGAEEAAATLAKCHGQVEEVSASALREKPDLRGPFISSFDFFLLAFPRMYLRIG